MRLQSNRDTIKEVRQLWKDCFHDTETYMDFYFSWKTKENVILGLHEDGKLVSMVHLNPYKLYVRGIKQQSYYIVGVATDSNYRKRGFMRRLLVESLERMYQERIPFTYLMPVKEAIYLPFDFRIVTWQKRLSIPVYDMIYEPEKVRVASIQQSHESDSSQETKTLICQCVSVDNIDEMQQLAVFANQRMAQTEDVYTIRDTYYYQRMLEELGTLDGSILVIKDGDVIKGYLAFVLEMGRAEVLELLCEPGYEEELREALKQEVRARSVGTEIKPVQASQAPPMMARIVHLEAFLELMRAKEQSVITFQVNDPFIQENCGCFTIDCSSSDCFVTKNSEIEYNKLTIDMTAGIDELTRLFFGQMSENELMKKEYCSSAESRQKVLNLLPLKATYLNEIV